MTDLFDKDREALLAEMEAWKKAQHYAYIDRNNKTVLARDLEDRLIKAEAKLARLSELADAIDRSTPEGAAIYSGINWIVYHG